MTQLRNVPAPAKLNLFLHVIGRRADGYHLLQTVFRLIDFCDTLHFTRRDDGLVQRITPLPGVPASECLTVRAALALQRATGCRYGVDIELEKRIPSGGGLGGGSSDAATVLLALNRLWATGLSRARLMELALPLGADVPVFVFGRNAFAEGIGEDLQPLVLPPRWYVVIQPGVQVPTADIFKAEELTRDTTSVRITDFSSSQDFSSEAAGQEARSNAEIIGQERTKQCFEVRETREVRPGGFSSRFGKNDLEPVVLGRFQEVRIAKQLVTQAMSCTGIRSCSEVRMSGSGSCLFIECVSRQDAVTIEAEIAATIRTSEIAANAVRSVAICAGLEKHPLQDWAI